MAMDLKVLLLDEDAAGRQRLAIRLQPMGYTVFQAGSYEEARAILFEHLPDIVLMEWGVKDKGGEELFKALQWSPSKTCVFTGRPLETLTGDLTRNGIRWVFRKSERLELLEHLEKLRAAVDASPKPSVAALAASAAGASGPRAMEVLVIDDSSTVRLSLKLSLQEKFPGCSVREADDGRAALAEMGHKKVDLLITDLEMPGMDGRDFLARIESNPILRRKPIIVYSGHITDEVRSAFGAHSSVRFLPKPCNPALVVEAAAEILSKNSLVPLRTPG